MKKAPLDFLFVTGTDRILPRNNRLSGTFVSTNIDPKRWALMTRLLAKIATGFVLLSLMLILGCGGEQSQKTEIVFYLRNIDPAQDQIWRDISSEFEQRNPEIKVKILNIPYEAYWSKLFTLISSGDPPDVVLMESGFYPNFVAKDALLDLGPFLAQDKDFSLDIYYPNTLEWLWIDESIYGIPTDTAVILPIFNKDLFDAAGVDYPETDWTYEDYLEICKRLTRDTDGDGETDVWGTFLPPWPAAVWAWGGDWVDDPENPTECTLDSPECVAAIQWVADTIWKHGVAPQETPNTLQVDPFLMQKVAITWNGHWQLPYYEKRAEFAWDVATLPVGPEKRAGWNFGSCLSITKSSKHPEAAWKLIRFFCGPEGAAMMAEQNVITPACISVAESPEFVDREPPEHRERFIEAIPHGHIFPKTVAFQELRSMIETELERAWIGEEEAQSVCERIARQGTILLERAHQESE